MIRVLITTTVGCLIAYVAIEFSVTIIESSSNVIDVYVAYVLIIGRFVTPPTYAAISFDQITIVIAYFIILKDSKFYDKNYYF